MLSTSSSLSKTAFVGLLHFFCGPSVCPAMKDGYGLYWDDHHISSKAASAFARQYLDVAGQASRAR